METIAYLPPPSVSDVQPLLENIRDNPPSWPLHFLTDATTPAVVFGTGEHQLTAPVTLISPIQNKGHKYLTSIAIFDAVVRRAVEIGCEYFMVLEPDCRVKGYGWDQRIFEEALAYEPDFLMAGTPVSWHTQWTEIPIRAACRRLLKEYNAATGAKIYDMEHEGFFPRTDWAFYPNGAFAIYKTINAARAWKSFHNSPTLEIVPWDMRIGISMYLNEMAPHTMIQFALTPSVLSLNDERFATKDWLKQQLLAGKVCGIHSIKDGWVP